MAAFIAISVKAGVRIMAVIASIRSGHWRRRDGAFPSELRPASALVFLDQQTFARA
ncbi:hypothetical protein [Cohnella sp. 56]|uniref:hypothetical protein n=1 Tax=Cohnella sp. 56 TaxID=3113722 RepID=UPI0030E8EA4A